MNEDTLAWKIAIIIGSLHALTSFRHYFNVRGTEFHMSYFELFLSGPPLLLVSIIFILKANIKNK